MKKIFLSTLFSIFVGVNSAFAADPTFKVDLTQATADISLAIGTLLALVTIIFTAKRILAMFGK